jgi:hypothetical protein
MVRSVGIAAVVLGAVWTGLAGAQSPSPLEKARYINVSEEGKPPQRCKLLKTWREADGAPAFQVQAVDTGELMTIVGSQQGAGGDPRAMSTRIFRWGRDNKPPAGAPVPPPNATVLTTPPAPTPTTMAGADAAPSVKPLPTSPAATYQTARSTPVLETVQKTDIAPVPTPVQPATKPYVMTPMSTQVVQHPSSPTHGELPPVALSTTASQPRLMPSAAGTAASGKSCNCDCAPSCNSCCQPCKPCNQSSCVTCTPSPMRQPFISRLFKSNTPCTDTAVACKAVPSSTGKPATLKPAAPALAKAATEPAKPGDWRESWGKVEPWKTPAPTSSKPTIELTKRVNPAPVPMEPSKQPDPLKDPGHYRDLVMNSRLTNSKIPQEPQPSAASRLSALRRPLSAIRRTDKADNGQRIVVSGAPTVHPVEETVVMSVPQQLPNGPMQTPVPPQQGIPMQNMAMNSPALIPPAPPPTRMVQIPANEANAFWSPTPPPGTEKDKSKNSASEAEAQAEQGIPPVVIRRGPVPMPPRGPMLMNPPVPPMAPYTRPGVPRPMSPDTGVADAMGNAFTLSGTHRPIPADFGGTPQEPNGFDPPTQMGQGSPPIAYGMGNPAMTRSPMPNMAAMAPQVPMPINPLMSVPQAPSSWQIAAASASARPSSVPQSLATLRDSIYPSERETAAERLSELNWRSQPLVVESLMKSAREDPAATVRAACIHALAQMKVDTPAAVALVRDLKSDRDPGVRQEAEEALSVLGGSGIQQAAHK